MNIDEIVDNFSLFDDWEDKYAYLIDLGRHLPPMDEALKTDETRVKGCLSRVWMVLGRDAEGKIALYADSDADIVKGLIAVLYAMYQGKTTEEAAAADIDGVFGKIGLDNHLFINRRNGFYAMVERIRNFTAGCK